MHFMRASGLLLGPVACSRDNEAVQATGLAKAGFLPRFNFWVDLLSKRMSVWEENNFPTVL